MPKTQVLVVDDSTAIRKILTEVIRAEPTMDVVGTAPNGKIALQKIPQLNPDIVTLDVEMPVMDGLETLKELRNAYPKLPVIMFSSLTRRGAESTLDALSLGASDYATKPAGAGGLDAAMSHVRDELIPKIKALSPHEAAPVLQKPRVPTSTPQAAPSAPTPRKRPTRSCPVDIVAIGVSTGGPNALAELIPALPKDFPVPIVLVQHMPPVFTKSLADRLRDTSPIDVYEAEEGMRLAPGVALIAPGDYHMVVQPDGTHTKVHLQQDQQENSCRPAVDVLFRSVAAMYGPRALGLILTGMGRDGLRGSEAICDAGGTVWAQDEATSVVWGMPGFVAKEKLAERVLPLQDIASQLTHCVATRNSQLGANSSTTT